MTRMLGIDTGGTYTDAVLVEEDLRVVATAKALTTRHDLAIGLREAMAGALAQNDSAPIGLVSVSTTLATNAIVEGQGSPICLLLIGYPEDTLARAGLREVMGSDPVAFIRGGHTASGAEQAPLDVDALRATILTHAPRVAAFAVSGYFAVRNTAHELQAQQLVAELTGLPVSCGHQLSAALDAPRRALTTALNARLIPLLSQLINAVQAMLDEHAIAAPLMVVKGDGSLVSAQFALQAPVETILSGPAASVVGARHLCGEDDVFVSDMGGTTTDIALLRDGRPVLNTEGASVGGWRTMVEAVQVHTYGLGGDSQLRVDGDARVHIGPRRVIPLSLLASQHPQTLEVLRAQAADPAPLRHAGEFALRIRNLPPTQQLSHSQARAWEALAKGPVALQTLLAEHTFEQPLARLVERGLVGISGFTPSDAAHVLSNQHAWHREAAELGARLWSRRIGAALGKPFDDVAAFCHWVQERVAYSASRCLITSAVAEAAGKVMTSLPAAQMTMVDAALTGADYGLLGVQLTLRRPLVAIGAPVATYYPRVAEQLHTRLHIPEHYAIANALGAVAGGVTQRVIAHITPLDQNTFRVHTAEETRNFNGLEEAAAYAAAEASRLASEHARQAGASEVRVTTRREDNSVEDGGVTVFFESTITATAYGRPRIAAGG